jgi:hypothetical protein
MNREDFQQDTRYALTIRDGAGHLKPASVYVYRLFDEFMVVRSTQGDGLLRKLRFEDIERIVRTVAVADGDRFSLPEALLQPKFWVDRDTVEAYSSSPAVGK